MPLFARQLQIRKVPLMCLVCCSLSMALKCWTVDIIGCCWCRKKTLFSVVLQTQNVNIYTDKLCQGKKANLSVRTLSSFSLASELSPVWSGAFCCFPFIELKLLSGLLLPWLSQSPLFWLWQAPLTSVPNVAAEVALIYHCNILLSSSSQNSFCFLHCISH